MTKRYKMCQRHIKFVKEEVKKELGTLLTAGLREEKTANNIHRERYSQKSHSIQHVERLRLLQC